jgi:lipopolysaccharide export system ATP-binding protein
MSLCLSASALKKSYKNRPILRGVDITLNRAEIVGMLGPNGAGKTTCFYLLCGLIGADSGQIILDGQDVTRFPLFRRARMGLGYLPQESSIFRGLNVRDNILAILEMHEPDVALRHERLDTLLSDFGLCALAKAPAIALSGGERRRAEIARALAASPRYILLDEPFAGIDPLAVEDIKHLILGLRQRGLGILITDHNVQTALGLVDRAYILHDGGILKEGTPEEIANDAGVRQVYLGEGFKLAV